MNAARKRSEQAATAASAVSYNSSLERYSSKPIRLGVYDKLPRRNV
jgi:hypothetical protein